MAKVKEVFIDSRESDSKFVAYFIDNAMARGYDVHSKALIFGDLCCENIYIERKAAPDFCASVCSDRLWTQLYSMKQNPEYASIVIISGGWEQLRKDDLPHIPQLEGAIKKILALGIPVIRVANDEELVDRAFDLFEHSSPLEVPIKRVDKNRKDSLFLALPNVGRKNGKLLMSEYKNMCELCEASQKELQDLLGPVKGKTVYDSLRGTK